MLKTGLVSVSFRSLPCDEIIRITKEAGLSAIEWGSDVHVPPHDRIHAEEIAEKTVKAGLTVSSYGSYYRAGEYGEDYLKEFTPLLDTADILGAPVIRIWAGKKGSSDTTENERLTIANECRALGDVASAKGITVAFECHNGTLTDNYESSVKLMREINHPSVRMYWQPNQNYDFSYNITALGSILPYLVNVHVFEWPDSKTRLPLEKGSEKWKQYLRLISKDNRDRFCLLEFMPHDDSTELPHEAFALKNLIKTVI